MHLMKCNKPDWREKPPGFLTGSLQRKAGAEASNEHRICFLKSRPIIFEKQFQLPVKVSPALRYNLFAPSFAHASKKDLHFNQV